jgi:hypothetical protein
VDDETKADPVDEPGDDATARGGQRMSARRASLLTLLAVVLVAGLAVGGFLGYRGYDRYDSAQDRAKAAEERARKAEARADTAYRDGEQEGELGAISLIGLDKPGWYAVNVANGPTPGVQLFDVTVMSKMAPCKSYWHDPADESIWSRDDGNC